MWLRAAAGTRPLSLPAYQRSNRPVETGTSQRGVVAHPLLILPPDVQRPAGLGQAALRHPGRSPYRCFLPDLTGFGVPCRAGPSPQHQTINAVSGGARPGGGIQPRCSGLRVQGTAITPSSATIGIVSRGRVAVNGGVGGGMPHPPAPSPPCGEGVEGGGSVVSLCRETEGAAAGRGMGVGGGRPWPRWSKTAGGAALGWQDALGGI